MSKTNIILSFMVVNHNQEMFIRRCLDSILRQKIRVPWEVVISDDASSDDSWQIIQQYIKTYNSESFAGEDGLYVPQFTCSQINSSEYHPTVTSDRCAANKANVYNHSRGKYCVNIDSDDFIIGENNYQYQIEQLEAHPECSLAMQNFLFLQDGMPIESSKKWWPDNSWGEGEIITFEQYCSRRLFISNQAFVMRRDKTLNPYEYYGLLFDDPIISIHHLISGNIICTQKYSYVHVQYSNSIWNQVVQTDNEILRLMTPLMVYLKFFNSQSIYFVKLELMVWIKELKAYLKKEIPLNISVENRLYVERLNCRLLNNMMFNIKSKHALIVLLFCKIISKFSLYNRFFVKCLLRIIG